MTMTQFDLSPLFRSSVGFDRLSRLFDAVPGREEVAYPPYNIEKLGDDDYRITMAVAGFTADDIEIVAQENQLLVRGNVAKDEGGEDRVFLHRGIAARAFERRFQLADHIRVDGAGLENGLLTISLVREIPEVLKPRRIEIGAGSGKKLSGKRAA
jgi:molecular chaperone IbpA